MDKVNPLHIHNQTRTIIFIFSFKVLFLKLMFIFSQIEKREFVVALYRTAATTTAYEYNAYMISPLDSSTMVRLTYTTE